MNTIHPGCDHIDRRTPRRRLEDEIARLVGEHVGGLIAEQNTIDEPFCRQLARATEPCAWPARIWSHNPENDGYIYRLNENPKWRCRSLYGTNSTAVTAPSDGASRAAHRRRRRLRPGLGRSRRARPLVQRRRPRPRPRPWSERRRPRPPNGHQNCMGRLHANRRAARAPPHPGRRPRRRRVCLMSARPHLRAQHDGGAALNRLEDEIARLVGEHVGGLIAEENTIDEPFCRQLARATEQCAGPAEKVGDGAPRRRRLLPLQSQRTRAACQDQPPQRRKRGCPLGPPRPDQRTQIQGRPGEHL